MKQVPDDIAFRGAATCKACQLERNRAKARIRYYQRAGVASGLRLCQWCGYPKIVGDDIAFAADYCFECKRERHRAKVRARYRRNQAKMTPAEREAYRAADAAWARTKRATPAGRESSRAAVQRYRERNRETYLESQRRSRLKMMSDPERAEEFRDNRRINYRLKAEQEGRAIRVLRKETYASGNGAAPLKGRRTLPSEPLVGLISEWLGEFGGIALTHGNAQKHALQGAGFTQLAELTGVSDRRLRSIVHHQQTNVHYDTADAICAALDTPIASLYPEARG